MISVESENVKKREIDFLSAVISVFYSTNSWRHEALSDTCYTYKLYTFINKINYITTTLTPYFNPVALPIGSSTLWIKLRTYSTFWSAFTTERSPRFS